MDIITLIIVLASSAVAFALGYLLALLFAKPKQSEGLPELSEKLAEISSRFDRRFEETKEKLTESESRFEEFKRLFIGAQTRGSAGESMLKQRLEPFIRQGAIQANADVGNNLRVEFAWRLADGKYLPIDSKFQDLEAVKKLAECKEQEEQKRLRKEIKDKLMKSIEEARKYQNQIMTSRFCVVTVPDSVYELVPEAPAEALKHGIVLTSHSSCALATFLTAEQYNKELEKGNEQKLAEDIQALESIIKNIEEQALTIERGLKIIENANKKTQIETAKAGSKRFGQD